MNDRATEGNYPHYPPIPASASLEGFILRFPAASRTVGSIDDRMALIWTAIEDVAAQTSKNRHELNQEKQLVEELRFQLVGDGPLGPNTGRLGEMQAAILDKLDERIEPVQNDVVFMRRFWKVLATILTLAIGVAAVVATILTVQH